MAPRRLLKAQTQQIEKKLKEFAQFFEDNDIDVASPYIYPLVQIIITAMSQIKVITKQSKK